ncbi:PIN domain-containing protein [Candidatus Woesearchaeota archaeon]|nr:PIN domain-containing protein [Candidatus Woesearchaeota archaeon]
MILETTFAIDFLKGREDAKAKMKGLIDENIPVELASPTVFELYGGLIQFGKVEKEEQKLTSFLKGFIVYPLDGESAKIAGAIDGKLMKKGLEIDTEDSMIAGIAIKNNRKVLTRDKHFERIEGLRVERY